MTIFSLVRFLAGASLGLTLGGAAVGEVTLASLFRDHAVLQRDQVVPVWGSADPGERVVVTFRGFKAAATADRGGRWRVDLEPMPASSRPATLVVAGSNRIRVTDIVVGEVWLCSGQSNMEYEVNPDKVPPDNIVLDNQAGETAAARYPLIRFFRVDHTVAGTPAASVGGAWRLCSPGTAKHFTAVGYFFAREVHQDLRVPVGIIDSSWGGTPIESWMSDESLHSRPEFAAVGERWRRTIDKLPERREQYAANAARWERDRATAEASGPDALAAFLKSHRRPRPPRVAPGSPWQPSSLYNGMIAPLAPCALRGILWYQGESNVPRAAEYAALFRTMIESWRRDWGAPELPFYFVQLAAYDDEHALHQEWAALREAQASALSLPATAMAVIFDNPDPTNLHPGNKVDVGRRLARIAEAKLYGRKIEWSGPVLEEVRYGGSEVRLGFSHADGLALRTGDGGGTSAQSRSMSGSVAHSSSNRPAFEVAGSDGIFRPADARIAGTTVIVSSPDVAAPVSVRYAWANVPAVVLFNSAGLPAAPFSTKREPKNSREAAGS